MLSAVAHAAKTIPDSEPPKQEFALEHPQGVAALDVYVSSSTGTCCCCHPPAHTHSCVPHSDIIKMTAQYTAVSGRRFLSDVAAREHRNPQFDFLKPTHPFFGYFTSLVESYTKVRNSTSHSPDLTPLPLTPPIALAAPDPEAAACDSTAAGAVGQRPPGHPEPLRAPAGV